MSKHGRLEALITVPTGGWTAAINDGASFNATVAAGTYTPTALATAFEAACEAGSAATYSFTLGNGESGTGVFALTCSSAFTVTWTSTDLRNALGFSGNLASATTQTASLGMVGMWLADAPYTYRRPRGNSGAKEGGVSQTVSPTGVTHTIKTASRTRLTPVLWSHVTVARAIEASESGAVRSFERLLKAIRGDGPSYIKPGAKVRLTWDADVSATYTDFYPMVPESTDLGPVDEHWRGLFTCQIEGWAV